ncbi:hypothetical protein [Ruegeria sp.]|uniref:hypothetical protein n=1 Tax=Ruegeria sp. TaxID=1879320 RepID=UPI003C7DEE43
MHYEARALGLPQQSGAAQADAAVLWSTLLSKAGALPDHRYDAPDSVGASKERAPEGTWSDLALALKNSQANKGVMGGSSMQDGTGAVAELPLDELGQDGQIPPRSAEDSAGIAAIVSVPHGDLALALDQQRTQELCLSLQEFCEPSKQHWTAEEARRNALNRDRKFEKIRELLDAPKAPTSKQVKKVLGVELDISALWGPPGNPQDEVMSQLRKVLKQRERSALSERLSDGRKAAAQAYCDEQKRLEDGLCDAKDAEPVTQLCGETVLDETAREAAMERACAAHHYASWPQYPDAATDTGAPVGVPDKAAPPLTEKAIVQRYASLRSDPVLSRLFGLSVDIELSQTDFAGLSDGFYLVAAQIGELTEEERETPLTGQGATWTLLEIADHGKEVKFWPATERAAFLGRGGEGGQGVPRQSHGLMALSQGACGVGADLPRFDLTSLELRTATEAEMQRRLARQANVDSSDPRKPDITDGNNPLPTDPLPEADDLSLGAKYLTGGLTLLTRSSGTDMAVRLARRDGRLNALPNHRDVVLDADDLTTGVRPIVGVPVENGSKTRWSLLTERDIDYGTSGSQRAAVQGLIQAVFAAPSMARLRDTLEAGYLTTPSRLLPTAAADQEAVVDEAFTTWDGSPMGVDITSLDQAASDVQAFGRTHKLPDNSLDTLRFGVPYRFALAAVYSGGISRPVESLPARPKSDEAPAYYPAPAAQSKPGASIVWPFFRFLRHEKIAAPQFALPLGHALRSKGEQLDKGGTRRNPFPFIAAGPMGFDTGPRMVLRSLGPTGGDDKPEYDARMEARGTPEICHRVVMAPSLPFDCAEWHGVFDDVSTDRTKGDFRGMTGARALIGEKGTLAAQRDPRDRENLIVARTNLQRGIGNQSVLDTRTYTDVPNAELASDTLKLGDAILKRPNELNGQVLSRRRDEKRLNRYYADPLARRLAFGIRMKGEDCYLDGGPLVYNVADVTDEEGSVFSQVPVVVTSVISGGASRTAPKKLSDLVIVGPDAKLNWLNSDASGDGFVGRNRHFPALELRLELRAGEAVEIDVWALPDDDLLAREHALIQSLGVRLGAAGRKIDENATEDEALFLGAKDTMPQAFVDALLAAEEALGKIAVKPTDAVCFIGPGGVETPSNRTLKILGRAVTTFLERSPLPEICGLTTLEAVHATNRMPEQPVALRPAQPAEPQASVLPPVPDLAIDQIPSPRPVRAARPANLDGSLHAPLAVCAPGSAHLVLDGTVPFNTSGNDIVEIVADVTLPGSSAFDDVNRQRSLAHRRKGTWPPLRGLDGNELRDSANQIRYRSAEDLFGFKVSRDGSVRFTPAKVTLLRVEGLPRTLPGGLLDLRALFFGDLPEGAREAHRHIFPDGKARRMTVRVNALSRTLEDMRTASRVARSNDPWTKGEGRIYDVGAQITGQVVPARHQKNLSDESEIVLPATIRPAKPDAKAPMPLLETEVSPDATDRRPWIYHKRHSSLRIPLGREWFSSGEGEAVGVVLWPPIYDGVEKRFDNSVPVPGHHPGDPDRRVDLDNLGDESYFFNDDDLGPGGKFVSRRGSDPVRGGIEKEAVLPPSAIADLMRDRSDIRRARMVENVLMPLDDEGSDPGQAEQSKVSPMRVALAVYEPRFDVEREEWYIDVTLDAPMAPEGFVRLGLVRYQPNSIPELRCSRPVVQWAQPLSARSVYARKNGTGRITVEMTGAAPKERKPIAALSGAEPLRGVDLSALTCQPAMRLTLFREVANAGETQRVLLRRRDVINVNTIGANEDASDALHADNVLVSPERLTDPLARWRHTIDLKEYTVGFGADAEDTASRGNLRLLVEEIEHFRPASYAEEPLASATDAAWQNQLQEAGPRFSAILNLGNLE